MSPGRRRRSRRVEADLKTLAGRLSHTGEAIGEASATAAAVLSYLMGQWIGLCHGALILEAEGMRIDAYGALLANISPILGTEAKHLGKVIQTNDYGSPESSLKTSGSDIIRLVRQAREAGINEEVPAFAAALFQRAIDAGYGPEEHAALIKFFVYLIGGQYRAHYKIQREFYCFQSGSIREHPRRTHPELPCGAYF